MCYCAFISTDSGENLSKRNSELVKFGKVEDADIEFCRKMLDYSNYWFVGSKSGCSCTFRYFAEGNEMCFGKPVDWYKEEQDEIDATKELYNTLDYLLSAGNKVDLVNKWVDTKTEDIKTIDVSLNEVSEAEFRMFENYKFRVKKETKKN